MFEKLSLVVNFVFVLVTILNLYISITVCVIIKTTVLIGQTAHKEHVGLKIIDKYVIASVWLLRFGSFSAPSPHTCLGRDSETHCAPNRPRPARRPDRQGQQVNLLVY